MRAGRRNRYVGLDEEPATAELPSPAIRHAEPAGAQQLQEGGGAEQSQAALSNGAACMRRGSATLRAKSAAAAQTQAGRVELMLGFGRLDWRPTLAH